MATKTLIDESPAPARSGGSFYRPELDALRFFACLAVFMHHVGSTRSFMLTNRWIAPVQQACGFGVCLFFLLSAYLITELLWKEKARSGSIHLRSFYMRRILRIWPLYFGVLLLYVLLTPLFPRFAGHPGSLVALTLMAGNWYFAISGWTNYAQAPMWSISVEEQFYVLVPTIAKLGGKRAIWVTSIFFLVQSQVALLYLGIHHVKADPSIWTNSFVQFQFFAGGSILALVLRDRVPSWSIPLRFLLFALGFGLWCIVGGALHILGHPVEPSVAGLCAGYCMVLVGAVLLFLAVYGIPSRWVPRWAIYLGKISFGLYLFHGFALEMAQHTAAAVYIDRLKHFFPFADILIEAGLTFLAASLSYRYFEKPFLRLKDRFAIVHSRPA
jgi:peptidoglycan/LPS O-acetylase OafA/YrhL